MATHWSGAFPSREGPEPSLATIAASGERSTFAGGGARLTGEIIERTQSIRGIPRRDNMARSLSPFSPDALAAHIDRALATFTAPPPAHDTPGAHPAQDRSSGGATYAAR